MENEDFDMETISAPAECVEIYCPEVPHDLKPKKGQEFESLDAVKFFYNAYAKVAGFSIRSWSQRKTNDEIIRKEYVCFKEGKSTMIADIEAKRRRGIIKEDCKARIAVVKLNSGLFAVSVFFERHTHSLLTPSRVQFLRSHRGVSDAQKCLTQQFDMVNIQQHQQFSLLGVQFGGIEHIGFTQKDLNNKKRDRRKKKKGHDGDMFHKYMKLEHGKNPSFTYKIEADDEQRITHCFWADATSRRAYQFYGDVVIFDTTYNINRYGLILAPLFGVNNHGQTVLFACSFLCDEAMEFFVWLFNKFLEAMPGEAPKMIITDQDPSMTKAISQTLQTIFHKYYKVMLLASLN